MGWCVQLTRTFLSLGELGTKTLDPTSRSFPIQWPKFFSKKYRPRSTASWLKQPWVQPKQNLVIPAAMPNHNEPLLQEDNEPPLHEDFDETQGQRRCDLGLTLRHMAKNNWALFESVLVWKALPIILSAILRDSPSSWIGWGCFCQSAATLCWAWRWPMAHDVALFWLRLGSRPHVLNMTREWCGPKAAYTEHKIKQIRYKIVDTEAPSAETLMHGAEAVAGWLTAHPGQNVYIHCKGGRSRSSSMLVACLLKQQRFESNPPKTIEQIIEQISQDRPVVDN